MKKRKDTEIRFDFDPMHVWDVNGSKYELVLYIEHATRRVDVFVGHREYVCATSPKWDGETTAWRISYGQSGCWQGEDILKAVHHAQSDVLRVAKMDPDETPDKWKVIAGRVGGMLRSIPCRSLERVIVSRHPAAIEFIRAERPEFAGAPVLESASASDVAGKVVAGNLPLHLAAWARKVLAVEFTGQAPRGAEYTLADMRAAGARLRAYRVEAV